MKRQTEWTVVLAVLAAIYLPMTLVTAIFGMNIREISMEATAPDKWSTVRTWGLVFGAIIGSILLYAVARYFARRWPVCKMLIKRGLKTVWHGRLYGAFYSFKQMLKQLWPYRKNHRFREKLKEWDVEAQKLEKME